MRTLGLIHIHKQCVHTNVCRNPAYKPFRHEFDSSIFSSLLSEQIYASSQMMYDQPPRILTHRLFLTKSITFRNYFQSKKIAFNTSQ